MAIPVQRPIIDNQSNIAIGLDLPTNSNQGSLFKMNYLTIDQALANAKNLIYTNHGERPMHPYFGCNLRAQLFENATEDLIDNIGNTIEENFKIWLPYIFINELLVEESELYSNRVNIRLVISLQNNQIDTRSIVLEVNAVEQQ